MFPPFTDGIEGGKQIFAWNTNVHNLSRSINTNVKPVTRIPLVLRVYHGPRSFEYPMERLNQLLCRCSPHFADPATAEAVWTAGVAVATCPKCCVDLRNCELMHNAVHVPKVYLGTMAPWKDVEDLIVVSPSVVFSSKSSPIKITVINKSNRDVDIRISSKNHWQSMSMMRLAGGSSDELKLLRTGTCGKGNAETADFVDFSVVTEGVAVPDVCVALTQHE